MTHPVRRLATGVVLTLCAGLLWAGFGWAGLLAPAAAAPVQTVDDDATVSWGTRPADNDVGTGRSRFGYRAEPGGRLRDAIEVLNRSDRPLRLGVYASDAFTTEAGGLDLLAADEEPADVGSWITLKRGRVVVPPHSEVSVPFTLEVPVDATPGDHTGGIVTSLVTEADQGVGVERRIGTRIYVRVAGELAPALAVSGVRVDYDGTWKPWSPGTATVRYTVVNTGNVRLQARQSVRVAGPFGLFGSTSHPADLPELLPGSSRTLTATVPGVWPAGRLRAQIRLAPAASTLDQAGDIPRPPVAVGAGTTWGVPVGQVGVLAVLVAAGLGVVRLRVRRRAAVAAAIDDAVAEALARSESGVVNKR